jgi:hypothetical protein
MKNNSDVRKKIKDANEIDDFIDGIGEFNKKETNKIYDTAVENTIKYSEKKTPFVAVALISRGIDSSLAKIIRRNNKTYEDFIREIQQNLASNYQIELTKKELKAIRKKYSFVINKLITNNES